MSENCSDSVEFDVGQYGPACGQLLTGDRLCDLGPGIPDTARQPLLAELDDSTLFPSRTIVDRNMVAACYAGLWLLHGFLDKSHRISQGIPTATGSYWHGIMHRREPDAANAKYWFQRVGKHPVFEPLGQAARRLANQQPHAPAFLARQTAWDPFAFIDLCEAARRGDSDNQRLCRQLAQAEWELLFDFSYRKASGAAARDKESAERL
jgi:hypothetical protein